ncbi:MAG: hypothetical protein ACOCXQ_03085 [Patescibacteria group bacterium]
MEDLFFCRKCNKAFLTSDEAYQCEEIGCTEETHLFAPGTIIIFRNKVVLIQACFWAIHTWGNQTGAGRSVLVKYRLLYPGNSITYIDNSERNIYLAPVIFEPQKPPLYVYEPIYDEY